MPEIASYSSVDDWKLEDFENAYRNWMERLMKGSRYNVLFDIMYDTEFRWKDDIPRDSDRAANGRYLRVRFAEEIGASVNPEWLDWPCSFLEFLVALALAIEDNIMYDPAVPDQETDIFWEMMDNCGLSKLDNESLTLMGMDGYSRADKIMSTVMDRTYDYNGYPGLFPLAKPAMNQRKVEIWYQANAYMFERYFE